MRAEPFGGGDGGGAQPHVMPPHRVTSGIAYGAIAAVDTALRDLTARQGRGVLGARGGPSKTSYSVTRPDGSSRTTGAVAADP
ncbi:hypothetical protein [Streptomyces sp. E2N166]|uniref:hypothetical protein n=1 Tax=Streptomyces sp. E2N166 TaxID=1851909 RepID=UPI000EF6A997|nr:hypothetical protein [Streptomyces sp. E2N166]